MPPQYSFKLKKVAIGALVGLLVMSEQARALKIFGRCISGPCMLQTAETGVIDPRRYDIAFSVTGENAEALEKVLKGVSELWRGRDEPVAGDAGLIARAKGDYSRILAALYNEGYYGSLISINVNGRQAANLSPAIDLPQLSDVVVRVEPGALYTFDELSIVNRAPSATDPEDIVEPPEAVGFVAGATAKAGVVRQAGRLAASAWRQQGYPKAKVADRQVTAIHPRDALNVMLEIQRGPHAVYGPVSVRGTERMEPGFVAYMTGLLPGEEYDPDAIRRAQKRLERLGVFAVASIEEAETVTAEGTLPLEVVVQEKALRRIGVGATYSNIDGFGAETFWLHRNLFGRAERLRLDAKVGGIGGTFDYQEFDYFLGATYTTPGVLTPDTDLVREIHGEREHNETYIETSFGGSAVLKHNYRDRLKLNAGVFAEYATFEDEAFGTRDFFTTGLIGDIIHDRRDDQLEPTKGHYLALMTKPFYEWEYGNPGIRAEAEGRGYISFDGDGRGIIAGRIKFGSVIGPAVSETPPDLLFFAGGGGSVRGYGYKTIGVTRSDGAVTGGRSLLEASLEFRQKITEQWGVVAFADAGVVGEESFGGFSGDVKVGVGAGLRYYTGLGAIRLDIAVPLDPGPDDPDFGIYAGIGQAF